MSEVTNATGYSAMKAENIREEEEDDDEYEYEYEDDEEGRTTTSVASSNAGAGAGAGTDGSFSLPGGHHKDSIKLASSCPRRRAVGPVGLSSAQ
mmetsp:Transcript_28772/g.84893  ORF Transcript_28772/g.84893 Transcript_28772/m.84893 type:complete len:94 (+) Transcript_28772:2333-2614(+)